MGDNNELSVKEKRRDLLISSLYVVLVCGILFSLLMFFAINLSKTSIKVSQNEVEKVITIDSRKKMKDFVESDLYDSSQDAVVEVLNDDDLYSKIVGTGVNKYSDEEYDIEEFFLYGVSLGEENPVELEYNSESDFDKNLPDYPIWLLVRKNYDNELDSLLAGRNFSYENKIEDSGYHFYTHKGTFNQHVEANGKHNNDILKQQYLLLGLGIFSTLMFFVCIKVLGKKNTKST